MERSRALVGSFVWSLLALACARAGEPAAPNMQYSSPPPELLTNDIGTLERDLEQNERVVYAQVGQPTPSGAPADMQKSEEKAPAPAAGAPAAADKAPAEPESAAAAPPPPPAPSPCADACRAFGSMQRSAGRICELAGNENDRCTRARDRVRTAEARLGQAGCACAPR
jgi:hypothetical protein